jgi:hypothetical protein
VGFSTNSKNLPRVAVGAREERPRGGVEVGRGDCEEGRDGDVGGGDWGGGDRERGQELERLREDAENGSAARRWRRTARWRHGVRSEGKETEEIDSRR